MSEDREEYLRVYSYEARAIMSGIPSRIHRIGLYVITLIVLCLFLGSYIFHYPDIVSANVQIKPSNITHSIITQTTGYIARICKDNATNVKAGDLIAEIASTSNGEDVDRALAYVQQYLDSLRSGTITTSSLSREKLVLGTLEQSYQDVIQSIKRLQFFQSQHYYKHRILEQHKLNELNKNIQKEAQRHEDLNQERVMIAYSQFQRDSILWSKGLISQEAYEQARTNRLHYEENLSVSINSAQANQRTYQEELFLYAKLNEGS